MLKKYSNISSLCLLLMLSIEALAKQVVDANDAAENVSKELMTQVPYPNNPLKFETISDETGAIGLMLSSHPKKQGDIEVLSTGKNGDAPISSEESKFANRAGNELIIDPDSNQSLRFINWSKPEGIDHEGDSESYVYAGQFGNSDYLKIDAFFGHDSPGVFLVNRRTGKALFVNTGFDLAFYSSDYKYLVIMNNGLSPAFGLMVQSLDETGHSMTLRCQATDYKMESSKIIPFFTGFHVKPYTGFNINLLVSYRNSNRTRYEAIPLRLNGT